MTDLNQLDNLFDELDTINTSLKKKIPNHWKTMKISYSWTTT